MLEIQKMITSYNHYNYNNIKYIVIHDTGNYKDTARNNALYFNECNRGASANYFVDETSIYQIIEDCNGSWHCGDGKGQYGITNTNSIGIEMCNSGGYIAEKTIQNTIELVKMLMKKYNINIEHIARHYDASRKICPMNMSSNNWELWHDFKKKLVSTEYIKLDGGSHGNDLNLIIRDFSKEVMKCYVYVDSDLKPSFAFAINPVNANYTKLEKNCSKLIKNHCGNSFTSGAAYKVRVDGYDKNDKKICSNTITIKTPKIEDKLYRVQVGAYKEKANAENTLQQLKDKGFQGYIKKV